MKGMPFSSTQSSAPGGSGSRWPGPEQGSFSLYPCFRHFRHFFDSHSFSLFTLPPPLRLYLWGPLHLVLSVPRLCCQLGLFDRKQQKPAPPKRTVNRDGKAEEAGSSEPTSGRHQPPPAPTHTVLGIPRALGWIRSPTRPAHSGREDLSPERETGGCRRTKRKRITGRPAHPVHCLLWLRQLERREFKH